MKIDLGSRVRDTITGFEGLVTAYSIYLTGCEQYLVQPTILKDGQPAKACWMDESHLEVLGAPDARVCVIEKSVQRAPGGPQQNAPPTSDERR